uniref:Secreted protein n=1 Tax=Periophthalmus magnuspinnatus TaxID=409849 RepID=A0A3B3ZLK4_9GOBI
MIFIFFSFSLVSVPPPASGNTVYVQLQVRYTQKNGQKRLVLALTPQADPVSGSCSCCCTVGSIRWVLSCLRRLDDTTKDFRHSPHLNGRSPECTRRCLLRLQRSANDLSHSVQEKGLSLKPRCARWCRLKLEGSENILPHCGQRKGFSPEWVTRVWLWAFF